MGSLQHHVAVDLKIPLSMSSCGYKHLITVTDKTSSFCVMSCLAKKSLANAFDIAVIFWGELKQSPGQFCVQRLRSVMGTVCLDDLLTYLLAKCIQHKPNAASTPARICKVHRQNRMVFMPYQGMLHGADWLTSIGHLFCCVLAFC